MPELHDYQRVARDHLLRNPQACLFLDMGLGKTATTLSALLPDQLPALVVAPKRVAENVWEEEVRIWRPELRIEVAKGTRANRDRVLRQAHKRDIIVISRDNMADVPRLWPRRDHPFRTVILDELSSFKSRASQRWRAARRITKGHEVTTRWGLTGTPSPNGLIDLWAQLALIDDGARLGARLGDYRTNYFDARRPLPNGVIPGYDIKGDEAAAQIHALLEDICISMGTEGRLDLPPMTFNTVKVPLPPKAAQRYKTMKKDLVLDLELIGSTERVVADTPAALSNKLSQLAAGFIYPNERTGPDDYITVHTEKLRAAEEIVDGTGTPVLMFYRYRPERDALLETFGDAAHTIDEPDIQQAWNAGNVPVLLAHPQSAGHGLNLQKGPGHTVVWTSPPWSLEEWEQAPKRLNRQGQKNAVMVHSLVAPGTNDEVIVEALMQKQSVQRALLDHLESPL